MFEEARDGSPDLETWMFRAAYRLADMGIPGVVWSSPREFLMSLAAAGVGEVLSPYP